MAEIGRKKYTKKQIAEQSARMKLKWACPHYREAQCLAHKNGDTGGHNKKEAKRCFDCGDVLTNRKSIRCMSCYQSGISIEQRRIAGNLGVIKQRQEETSIEKKLYQELKDRGLLFEKQKLINGKFLVDAYIPLLNLIIEADGNYWHSLERVVKKDKSENAYLTKCGYNLLRLSETEINDGSFKERIIG